MNNIFFKIVIGTYVFFLIGCSSIANRESNPNKFDLLKTGWVQQANVLPFKNCLMDNSVVRDRIAYNVKTKQLLRSGGYRVDSIGGETYLLLSIDVFDSGKTQLFRVKNSELTDLTQQINAFDMCLSKYK